MKGLHTKGFTLIETVILIVVAGILLPVLVVPFVTSVKRSEKPERVNTAMFLAQQKMEELTKYAYTDVGLNPTALTPYASTDVSNYQWQWSITWVDSSFRSSPTDEGYKQILVRVMDPEKDAYEVQSVVTHFP